MAKIIVTEIFPKGECFLTRKKCIDTNCKVEDSGAYPRITTLDGERFLVVETIEEICKLINQAEAQATDQKVDEINENLKKILRTLDQLYMKI